MKSLHRANTRGRYSNSWLSSYHTFSFGDYIEPTRMGFGTLRVLNDDTVAPEGGFATHPHANMEIVSIPLAGSLSHRDSVGNSSVIQTGEVQLMSAGTGITHSEFNPSSTSPVNFLQIWVLPKERNIAPRYAQTSYQSKLIKNRFVPIVVPIAVPQSHNSFKPIEINQDAYFSLCSFDFVAGSEIANAASYSSFRAQHGTFPVSRESLGVYFFLIEGSATFSWLSADGTESEKLNKRDALGLHFDSGERTQVQIQGTQGALLLAIEVPF